MTIIDTHAHIYPDKIALKATRSIGEFYDIQMALSGTVDTLLQTGRAAGISRWLVHSVAISPERVTAINDFILAQVQQRPSELIGFAAMHPDHPDVAGELRRVKLAGLKGVKLHPDFQHFCLDDDSAIAMFRACAALNMPVLVHTGDTRYPYSQPERMAAALDKVPDLKAICAHLGGWSVWSEAWKVLSGRKNVWVDTSSSLYAISPEEAAQVIRHYGAERAFFGTDYPMWKPDEELKRFMRVPLRDSEREGILHGNFERFLASLDE